MPVSVRLDKTVKSDLALYLCDPVTNVFHVGYHEKPAVQRLATRHNHERKESIDVL